MKGFKKLSRRPRSACARPQTLAAPNVTASSPWSGLGGLMKLRLGLRSTWPDEPERLSCFPILRSLRVAAWLLCRPQVGDPPWFPTAGRSSPLQNAGKFQEFSAFSQDIRDSLASNHGVSRVHSSWMVVLAAPTGPLPPENG